MKGHSFKMHVGVACRKVMWLLALVWLWLAPPPAARAANVDSLRTVLAGLKPDTSSIREVIKMTVVLRAEGLEEAIVFAQRGIELANKLGLPKWQGDAWTNLSSVYHFRSDYDKALDALVQAMKYFQQAGYEIGVAKVHVNMSAIYLNRNNYDLAERHLIKANEIATRLKLKQYIVTINTNLAIIYVSRKEYDKAMQYNLASLELLKETGDSAKLVLTYSNIGYLYGEKADLQPALEYYDKALESARGIDDMPYEVGFALQNKIGILLRMKRAREASTYTDQLWKLVKQSGSDRLMAESCRTVSDMYSQLADYKRAFEYMKQYHILQDSLMTEDQNARITEMEKAQELQEKEAKMALMTTEATQLKREAQLKEEQAANQRIFMIGMAVLLTLTLVLVFILVAIARSRSKALRELQRNHLLIESQKHEIIAQNQTLRAQNERLEDLNREKDGLVGIVAHDLKSPLSKSLGLLDLIEAEGPLNEAQLRAADMIRRVNATGSDLIRDLLDLNAVEESDAQTQVAEVSLEALFREMEAAFGPEAKRKALTLAWTVSPDCPMLVTDRKALGRIMDNLVSNAMKFSPKGRQVIVTATSVGNKQVRISVRDQGPGIGQEDQQKLFKKFQRLSARPTAGESSTGLGLAITQALVHKLQGEIQVESKLGEGATFSVSLPISAN